MAEPTTPSQISMKGRRRSRSSLPLGLLILILAPVAAAMLMYQLHSFDPAPIPIHEFSPHPMAVPSLNPRMLQGSERIAVGKLLGPEDIAYHPDFHLIYTGCADGWVKLVTLNDSTVRNWAFTGGRPLGVALGHHGRLAVADAEKGLLEVTAEGNVEMLTDEAEGVKFKLTDGVDVADDGTIYFTDASHKYNLKDHVKDILEGRPNGRLMSFDPSAHRTTVLVRDLFFANGVVVSPDQSSVIFCESVLRRCLKYHIEGERKGTVEKFIDNMPGTPDNILYDGEGHYWIALSMGNSWAWDLTLKYGWIRKVVAMMESYLKYLRPSIERNGGVLSVDLEGKAEAHYYDPGLSGVTSGVKIGNHLYLGSVSNPYITRLDLLQYAAAAAAAAAGRVSSD